MTLGILVEYRWEDEVWMDLCVADNRQEYRKEGGAMRSRRKTSFSSIAIRFNDYE